MEGVALSPDGTRLFTLLQSATIQDSTNDQQTRLTVNLRAERAGNGTGRIYTITVVSEDDLGQLSAPVTVTVTVPKSSKK